MTYKVIWNGRRYYEQNIKVVSWIEFTRILTQYAEELGMFPDLIYLISERE